MPEATPTFTTEEEARWLAALDPEAVPRCRSCWSEMQWRCACGALTDMAPGRPASAGVVPTMTTEEEAEWAERGGRWPEGATARAIVDILDDEYRDGLSYEDRLAVAERCGTNPHWVLVLARRLGIDCEIRQANQHGFRRRDGTNGAEPQGHHPQD